MKVFLAVAVALFSPAVCIAQDRVPLAITTNMSVDDRTQKDTLDSARHLSKCLGPKSKIVRLVDTPEQAVVVIEVLGRRLQAPDPGDAQQDALGRVRQTSYKDKILVVRLLVRDYSTQIEGRDETWSAAAGDAAREIEKWIKSNRSRLPEPVAH